MHFSPHKGLKILVAVAVIGIGMFVANHIRRAGSVELPPPAPLTPAPPVTVPAAVEVPRNSLKWDTDHFMHEGKPFTGVATEYHPDGKPKQRWEMKDGKWHGLVEEWYPSGQKSVSTNYDNGKHHGENTYWNPDGTVQKRQLWDQEKLLKDEHPNK